MINVINKTVSGIIFLAIIAITYLDKGMNFEIISVTIKLLIPMACIWFGYELTENMSGPFLPPKDYNIEGIIIVTMGWIILLGKPLAVYFTQNI